MKISRKTKKEVLKVATNIADFMAIVAGIFLLGFAIMFFFLLTHFG